MLDIELHNLKKFAGHIKLLGGPHVAHAWISMWLETPHTMEKSHLPPLQQQQQQENEWMK